MKLNSITTGIELAGTTVKNLYVKNNIVDIEYEGERNFGMNINEPLFEKTDSGWFAMSRASSSPKIATFGPGFPVSTSV